jgi:hypothetical protein
MDFTTKCSRSFTATDFLDSCAIGHDNRMSPYGFDDTSPPLYPYLKATSAHSAAVQLYARSGQLATMDVLYARGKANDNRCPLGCDTIGNMHHLFIHCAAYAEWRIQAGNDIVDDTGKKLRGLLVERDCELIEDDLTQLAESIFSTDSSKWLLGKNVYYLGKHPPLTKYIDATTIPSTILRRRVISHLSSEWHTRCIRLSGRIFGDYQRRMAVMNRCRKRAS